MDIMHCVIALICEMKQLRWPITNPLKNIRGELGNETSNPWINIAMYDYDLGPIYTIYNELNKALNFNVTIKNVDLNGSFNVKCVSEIS